MLVNLKDGDGKRKVQKWTGSGFAQMFDISLFKKQWQSGATF